MLFFPRLKPLPPLSTETPLVSVVLFCRNRVRFIRKAIESILAQSYPHWELVIQDGASTDGTLEILQSYADPRIKLVSEADQGPFDAMWRAFRRCQGEVIGSCLSDEELLPQTLSHGVQYLLCNPEAAAVFGDLAFHAENGQFMARQNCSEFNPLDYLGFDTTLTLQATLFRRRALEEIGLFTRAWRTDCADFELMIHLGENYRLDYHPGVVGRYCQFHEGQLSTTPSVGFFCAVGQLKLIDDFFGRHPERNLLRDIPLRKAYQRFSELYALKGATDWQHQMDQIYAQYKVPTNSDSLEKALQAVRMGKLMLALEILPKESMTKDNSSEVCSALAEILEQLPLPQEAANSWEWLAQEGLVDAEERYLNTLLGLPGTTLLQVLAKQKKWARGLMLPSEDFHRPLPTRLPQGRIRLAFHASDWTNPELQLFLLPWLPHLETIHFEVFVYYPADSGPPSFPEAFHRRPIAADISDREFAELVRDDQIDIFVELSRIYPRGRWGAIAARCAPVQISYLGHPATLGLRAVDYRITDETLAPPTMDRFFTEKLIRLPQHFACFAEAGTTAHSAVASPRRLDHRFTFVSFAPSLLMNRTLIDQWAEILHAVPGSRLLLSNPEFSSSDARTTTRAFFTLKNVELERVNIVPRQAGKLSPYLLAQADLYLDTYPHSDVSGVAQALAQGIPVVTLSGETMASRLGDSFLRAAGLSQYVARHFSEYREIAQRIANQPEEHQSLTAQLPQKIRHSGLTDLPRFASTFQKTLLKLVNK